MGVRGPFPLLEKPGPVQARGRSVGSESPGSSAFLHGCLFPVGFTALWGVRAWCSGVGSTEVLLLDSMTQLPSQEYAGEGGCHKWQENRLLFF